MAERWRSLTYDRFRHPQVVAGVPMLIVAIIGLAVNAGSISILRAAPSESLNLKGAYFEVLSDAISSIGVLIAAAVIWLTDWPYADPLVSAGIGLFIVPRTARLVNDAIDVLLEGTPVGADVGRDRAPWFPYVRPVSAGSGVKI